MITKYCIIAHRGNKTVSQTFKVDDSVSCDEFKEMVLGEFQRINLKVEGKKNVT
jgi:hypothetical protein